jgi:lysophospholipase L1-like esterase
MRINVRRVRSFAISLLVVVLSSLVPAATAQTHGLRYVALGDSYSSGLGLGDDVSGSPDYCHRSQQNFPHRVAQALGMKLDDVTCAGATTQNVVSAPLEYGRASTPIQAGALSARTDVVTISIGGNDLGFVDAAQACVALGPTGPLLASAAPNCQSRYVTHGADALLQRLTGTVNSRLESTFARIHRDAPNAKVFVVGYPTVFPDSAHTPAGGCFDARIVGSSVLTAHAQDILPFTNTDVVYLHSIEQSLDDVTSAAAKAAGFTYVSTLAASAAHSACATGDDRYVNGVSVGRSSDGGLLLGAGSLHPNSAGAAFLAATVQKPVSAAFVRVQHPAAATPSVPWAPIIGSAVFVFALGAFLIVVVVRRRRAGTPLA